MARLSSTKNQFGGVVVSAEDLPVSADNFNRILEHSIESWIAQQVKVVWIKVPINRSELLPFLYGAGFENHHCRKEFFMLTRRIQADALVPDFANHTIGVGGLVINENNELLTIREKDHVEKFPRNWKFPGGMLDSYEKLEQGVIREIREETGVKAEFEKFIGFLHHNNGQFMTSNIYAVCKLKALSHEITIQESEIADARWCAVEEYLNDDKISDYNRQILKNAVSGSGLKSGRLSEQFYLQDYEVFF